MPHASLSRSLSLSHSLIHSLIPSLSLSLSSLPLSGTQYENSNEIGVFANLTNSFCLLALGGSEHFKVLEGELEEHITLCRTSK